MTVPESSEGTTNYELIETLWNVNHYVASGSTALCVELIETLRNVNVTISFLNLAKCPN